MATAIAIILILVCFVLGFLVLIQNPKGGGLSGSFGGLGQQMMGVQQSTDTVEKGTWIFAGAMAILCLLTVLTAGGGKSKTSRSEEVIKNAKIESPAAPAPSTNTPIAQPGAQAPSAAPTNSSTAPASTASQTTAPANAAPATK